MKKKVASQRPVSKIVETLIDDARRSRSDGPSSPLYGHRAQLSTSLNQAGTWLAKLDKDAPPQKPTLFQTVLGLSAAKPEAKKRSWFFASGDKEIGLSTRRVEQLLKASAKDGSRLSLESPLAARQPSDGDVHCVLPEGASDPVCEPRK